MGISLNAAALLNGNGIDVNSLVSQVQAQESGQLTVWQQEQTTLQTQATALGTLNTDLTNLQTAVNALKDPLGALTAVAADSSMPAILTATADTTATSGTHTVVVNTLASPGTVYTNAVAGGAGVSILPSGAISGDLQLQIGGSSGSTKDIQITAGINDTVTTLANYINTQSTKNNWGVTASVLSDATGARLAIYSSATGTPGALAIAANTTTSATVNTTSLSSADSSFLNSGQTTGTVQLQIGGSGGTTANLAITAGTNDTLNSLASYITDQSTQNNWGITASVVSDSNGYHLAITNQATGAAGALAVSSNDTGLKTVANPATNLTFVTPIGGTNASFTIDGVPFSSTTNTVTEALPGVTMNLISAEPSVPLQVSVGPDTAQATTAINAFVVAYNTLISAINDQYQIDPTTNLEGPLGSDSSLRTLQSSLLSDVAYSPAGSSGIVNLQSLGITTNDDGTLTVGTTVDNKSLSDVMTANPSAFVNFFQNASTGFAHNFGVDLTNLTDLTNGVLNLDLAQNSTEQTNLTTQISNFNDRMAAQKTELLAQFSQVNAALESYPYLLAELNAALGNPYTPSTNSTPTAGSSTSSTSSSSNG